MQVYVYDPSPHFPRHLTGNLNKWLWRSKFKIPLLCENFDHTTSIQKVSRTQTRSQQSDVTAESPAPMTASHLLVSWKGPWHLSRKQNLTGAESSLLQQTFFWGHYRGTGRSSGGRPSRPLKSSQTSHWESLQSPKPSPGKALEKSDVLCNTLFTTSTSKREYRKKWKNGESTAGKMPLPSPQGGCYVMFSNGWGGGK